MNVPDRILRQIAPMPHGCHIWTGPVSTRGYPKTKIKNKDVLVHRLLAGASVGDGKVAMHTCDEPLCVNPDHLKLGTHTDNMADMKAKGRTKRGRLPDDVVMKARQLYRDGSSIPQIIESLSITETEEHVRDAVTRTYKYLPGHVARRGHVR